MMFKEINCVIFSAPDHCELQKFALDLCRRNMSAYYSFKACKLENEDVDECMKATKRVSYDSCSFIVFQGV